ncbi:MAG: glycosyltransferase family 2 protein [Fibrobacteraceae bacterium]|nr:glycosyltransferase family 2 protein [Fibrobacteraceae bacterium]
MKFSVVITTKNRHALLENAIQSVLAQTVGDIECIVVDDASVDETRSIYEKDSRIVYIRIDAKDSRGGNYARNQGVARATGEFIAFLDDDDEWLPNKLKKQLELYNAHPGSVIFCGRTFKKVSSEDAKLHTSIPPEKYSGNLSRLIRTTYVTSTSCLFFPRNLLDLVGNFDERLTFWQEYELCIRLAQVAEFYFVPEALVVCLDEVNSAARVSNKVLNWKENTSYIRNKHKVLYDELTFVENWAYHATLMKDAFRRHQRAGKKFKSFYYGVLRLLIEYIPTKLFHIF